MTEQTYCRWRKEHGGMKVDQAMRLKELELEDARLKKLLAEAKLDKAILKEAALEHLLTSDNSRFQLTAQIARGDEMEGIERFRHLQLRAGEP